MDDNITYKESVVEQIRYFSADEKTRFIGYNTINGSRMYGTLDNIPAEQCVEMPVCENLMVGMAVGMALEGYKPVVCFERHDFMLIAMDALVNHADKMRQISGGQCRLPIIVRAIVGAKEPLNPGLQHTQDYTRCLRDMLQFSEVVEPMSPWMMKQAWREKPKWTPSGVVVIVEHRDRYTWTSGFAAETFKPTK